MIKKIIFIVFITISSNIFAQLQDSINKISESPKIIYKFEINKEIGPSLWRHTKQSFEEAEHLKADYVLIHMNTYGGLVDAADSIRTKILNSKIPVLVFIDNNAASAGALISIACDSIYMRPGANIGAATVVNQTGKAMPDKYQAYMRSTMRSTAEAHGKDTIIEANDTIIKWRRDPKIAEAMVDQDIYIEGLIDTGKVLTFTAQEALKYGFCDGIANSIPEVLEKAGINNYEIKEYKITATESIIGFLINPMIHGLLIMIIIGGIYFELQTPGIGFPLAAAVIAAVLFFAPLYIEGIAENWEIIAFIIGVILLVLEIFVIPGFGVAGISGIILMVVGLTFGMVEKVTFAVDSQSLVLLGKSFFLVLISIFLSILLSIYFGSKLLNKSFLSFLVLNSAEDKNEGFIGVNNDSIGMKGKKGVAATILRPAGKVIIDSEYYDAKAQSGYINKGEKIIVIGFITNQLYVTKDE